MSFRKITILTEDWTVVLLGFIAIFIALGGYIAPIPSYGWKEGSELFEKVLTASNLISISVLWFFFYLFFLAV